MEICPECRPCLERLVELTVELATDDPRLRREAHDEALAIISREFAPGAIPALIANKFHLAIQEASGNPDPFTRRKASETAYLARMYARVAPGYPANLTSLIKLAAVGNALDFFRGRVEMTRDILADVDLGVADFPSLEKRLSGPPGLMLYLADNAGEQFFDRPLLEYLRGLGWQVLYVIKGGPIQNDLTREDLEASGVGAALLPVVESGARTVGLVLNEVSPQFLRLYSQAQIIIAKGMGHFETLSRTRDPRLFFLLQAKCRPVAQALGVPRGTFVFQHAPGISLDTQPAG